MPTASPAPSPTTPPAYTRVSVEIDHCLPLEAINPTNQTWLRPFVDPVTDIIANAVMLAQEALEALVPVSRQSRRKFKPQMVFAFAREATPNIVEVWFHADHEPEDEEDDDSKPEVSVHSLRDTDDQTIVRRLGVTSTTDPRLLTANLKVVVTYAV